MGLADRLSSPGRRIGESIRQEGLLAFALRALSSPVYRAGVLNARPLSAKHGEPAVAVTVVAAGRKMLALSLV